MDACLENTVALEWVAQWLELSPLSKKVLCLHVSLLPPDTKSSSYSPVTSMLG